MKLIEECPLCTSTSTSDFMNCEDFTVSHEKFQISSCNDCGFHFTSKPPEESEIGDYYKSEEYISHSSTQKGFINKIYQIVRKRALKNKVKLVKKYLHEENTLTDIGAGTGHFVNECLKNNIKATGFEPDEIARTNAKSIHGINLQSLDQFDGSDKVEVITMWHVLEHVYGLNAFIENLKDKLFTGGIWIIAVPNMSSFDAQHYKNHWAAYDVPRHLYHFQPDNIKWLAENNGFDLIEILPMKYDSFYVSMLSEKYKKGSMVKGIWNGLKSNIKAKNNSYSSQIYILKKK